MCICAAYVADDVAGTTVYGYISDSCADANFWCQGDKYHLDISEPLLSGDNVQVWMHTFEIMCGNAPPS